MLWAIFSHFRTILLCTQLQVLLSQHAISDGIDGDPRTLKKSEKIERDLQKLGQHIVEVWYYMENIWTKALLQIQVSKLFRTFASIHSEVGSHNVQWISGGDCILVTSFLTCPLLLQLFERDVLPFETRSVFFDQTGQKSKNQLKIVGQVFATPLQNSPY